MHSAILIIDEETPGLFKEEDYKERFLQVEEAVKEAGARKLYVYTQEQQPVFEACRNLNIEIQYLTADASSGSAGFMDQLSTKQRREDFSDDFLIIHTDHIPQMDWNSLLRMHEKNYAVGTLALMASERSSAYGIELGGEHVIGISTQRQLPYTLNGIYVFSPRSFDFKPEELPAQLETQVLPAIAQFKGLFGAIVDKKS